MRPIFSYPWSQAASRFLYHGSQALQVVKLTKHIAIAPDEPGRGAMQKTNSAVTDAVGNTQDTHSLDMFHNKNIILKHSTDLGLCC